MAITPALSSVADPRPVSTFTFSLDRGWKTPDGRQGSRPAAGNVVLLVVLKPDLPVMCPPGWTAVSDRAFYATISPSEPDPVFSVYLPFADDEDGEDEDGDLDWKIQAYDLAGVGDARTLPAQDSREPRGKTGPGRVRDLDEQA
jgi:hypothetical protein